MMAGYYNRPEATAETIDKEGWLHTGDIGHYDSEGYFKIVDRTKDLIKVKGLQVSPSELEDVILQHEDVQEVCVVGVPHSQYGEVPLAFVVSKKPLEESTIHNFLDDRVAPHKKLSGGVMFVENLPKSNMGKLLRKKLKEIIKE